MQQRIVSLQVCVRSAQSLILELQLVYNRTDGRTTDFDQWLRKTFNVNISRERLEQKKKKKKSGQQKFVFKKEMPDYYFSKLYQEHFVQSF